MGLMIGIFASLIGLLYLKYGKKEAEFSFIFPGIFLMFYAYFVPNLVLNILIGVILIVSPFILRRIF